MAVVWGCNNGLSDLMTLQKEVFSMAAVYGLCMIMIATLGLLLGTEALVMTPNGTDFPSSLATLPVDACTPPPLTIHQWCPTVEHVTHSRQHTQQLHAQPLSQVCMKCHQP